MPGLTGSDCAAVEVLLGTPMVAELIAAGEFDVLKEVMKKCSQPVIVEDVHFAMDDVEKEIADFEQPPCPIELKDRLVSPHDKAARAPLFKSEATKKKPKAKNKLASPKPTKGKASKGKSKDLASPKPKKSKAKKDTATPKKATSQDAEYVW